MSKNLKRLYAPNKPQVEPPSKTTEEATISWSRSHVRKRQTIKLDPNSPTPVSVPLPMKSTAVNKPITSSPGEKVIYSYPHQNKIPLLIIDAICCSIENSPTALHIIKSRATL